jgi:CrcB protein
MREVFLVAVFGAIGSVSRYAVSAWAGGVFGDRLPFGTLIVNVVGSLLIGFIMHVGLASGAIPQGLRVPVVIGFLGAFTTFSSFSYETMRFFSTGNTGAAVVNMAANLILCLFATGAGFLVARAMLDTA